MRAKQQAGPQAKKGKQREAKDFDGAYEAAKHVSTEGWCGIPISAFRSAMISACRMVGFKMTIAKMSVFIDPDGYDRVDGTGLVRITRGEPKYVGHPVRNQTGVVDVRPRPMWSEGWEASVRLRWDAEQPRPSSRSSPRSSSTRATKQRPRPRPAPAGAFYLCAWTI